jgi:alpha-1,2-mannosyltransferase
MVLRLFLRRLGRPAVGLSAGWLAAAAVPAAVALDPVRVALVDGQIDIPLMALVAFDTLGPGLRIGGVRARGLLIGLAAALKLTPAAYVLFYLARRQYRDAATAAASFAGFTLLGFLAAPRDSFSYWTHVVFQTDRIGSAAYASNQSIRGLLARIGLLGPTLDAAWFILAGLVALAVLYSARRLHGQVGAMAALLLTAIAELLISPISWAHHWVWAAPGLLLLAFGFQRPAGSAARTGGRLRVGAPVVLAAVGCVLFALGPQWLLPHGGGLELAWSPWQLAVGDAYVWYALVVLGAALYVTRGRPSRPHIPAARAAVAAALPVAAGLQADQDERLADRHVMPHQRQVRRVHMHRIGRDRTFVRHLVDVPPGEGAAPPGGQRPNPAGAPGQRERPAGRVPLGGFDRPLGQGALECDHRARRPAVVVPRGAGTGRPGDEPRRGAGAGVQAQPRAAVAGRGQPPRQVRLGGEPDGQGEQVAEVRPGGGAGRRAGDRGGGGVGAELGARDFHGEFTFRACRITGKRQE